MTRGRPIQRTFFFSASRTRYAPTATVEKVMENSYMLPQGARCTDSARASDAARLAASEGEHGEGDRDPAVEVALLVAACAPGPSGTSRAPAADAGDDLGPLQDGGAAALLATCTVTAGAAACGGPARR